MWLNALLKSKRLRLVLTDMILAILTDVKALRTTPCTQVGNTTPDYFFLKHIQQIYYTFFFRYWPIWCSASTTPSWKKKCYARKNARPGYVLIHIYQIWANIAYLFVPILTDMNALLFFFLAARIPSHHGRRWAKILGAQFSCFSGTKVQILTQKAFYYITRHMSGCSTGRGLFSWGGLKL